MAEARAAGANRAREYETVYVLSPDVARDAQERVASRIDEVVGKEGGKLTLVENWGRRALAYPVSKHKRGVYVYLKYAGGGALVNEIERNLRMLDEVLKYQTVKLSDELDLSKLDVDPENLKFEAVEPPGEDETEETLEQILGLDQSPDREPARRAPDDDGADAGASGDDGQEAEEEEEEEDE